MRILRKPVVVVYVRQRGLARTGRMRATHDAIVQGFPVVSGRQAVPQGSRYTYVGTRGSQGRRTAAATRRRRKTDHAPSTTPTIAALVARS